VVDRGRRIARRARSGLDPSSLCEYARGDRCLIWPTLLLQLAVILSVAARATGLSWREAGALGVLMNTRGLVELILLNVGLEIGVITPSVFTMMVVMALVTTVITTPLLQWIYPTPRAVTEAGSRVISKAV
jgi:Kef-type K+ transport system membrane component KefB